MRGLLIALATGILIGAGFTGIGMSLTARRITLTRLNPAETLRASLVEPEFPSVDRNVQIRLEDLVSRRNFLLALCPEEGGPYGSERLIWSKDGEWLLLVGRHFFVERDLYLDNGDQLYYLHHIPSKKSWRNARGEPGSPALKADTIEGIDFTEPVRLRPR